MSFRRKSKSSESETGSLEARDNLTLKKSNSVSSKIAVGTVNETHIGSPNDVQVQSNEPLDQSFDSSNGSGDLKEYGAGMSCAIPERFNVDPFSPNALAVSTELIERLGNGITTLKEHGKKIQKCFLKNNGFSTFFKKSWNSVVTVILIEAQDLPDEAIGGSVGFYCKFRLGTETYKSKVTSKTPRPVWRERFNLHWYDEHNLELIVWQKGKQKNFIGRSVIDLSKLEKDCTHDIWQNLDAGYGSVHILLTISGTTTTTASAVVPYNGSHVNNYNDKYVWHNLKNNWNSVGSLTVTIHCAKGLAATGINGKSNPFCVLELDNARVQTHTEHCTTEPSWDKIYTFVVNDITSTLDVAVYDESILKSMKGETLGKVTIPLLRVNSGEKRWYALKDKTKKSFARGNYPRILLEIDIVWNPVKASMRVLSPKETKYMQKPAKFDIPLIYSNLKFIRDTFQFLFEVNNSIKLLFEWQSTKRSFVALLGWLLFWYYFKIWMAPLLLLLPFLFHYACRQSHHGKDLLTSLDSIEDNDEEDIADKDEKTLKSRMFGLQDLTLTIKNGIDYAVSLAERLKNLSNFTVPYLSYLAIVMLVASSVAIYFLPANYLFMALGIYKFTRKFLNPERVPNNDLLDFLSRVPDDEMLKQWKELKVPEPSLQRAGSMRKS